ncbi:acylphosphatase [Candidatus Aerophobetes bacterium]|uniref:acylphosphatase n=1 Tax=Aerophobetes bacterium TaxID=2030807 RepID=A0A2A4YDG2_UNCAE|nr:MAG: acylphosphatase [Candidatus Aerophobetes bacterium]
MHYHVVVKGRVQGVCFRATVCERAQNYDLSGTVKNLANEDVEIHAFGEEKIIDAFLESLKQDAGFGMVSSFSVKKDSLKNESRGFKIVH